MRRGALDTVVVVAALAAGCGEPARPPASPSADAPDAGKAASAFLASRLVAFPGKGAGALAVTDPATKRIAIYDSALVALASMRAGDRAAAARLFQGLAAVQEPDGALPFSFVLPAPDRGELYVRAGAIAWVGYAAAEYLDAEPGGPAREVVAALAHRAAGWLLAHQVAPAADDPRSGLVRAGLGVIRYEVTPDGIRERFVPGEVPWASVEHNVDAWFFLHKLAKLTGDARYRAAADRIAEALATRTYVTTSGQLAQGVGREGPDTTLALDCASWGSLFLLASGDRARGDTAAAVSDGRYASFDPRSRARGHRPHVSGRILEDRALFEHLERSLPAKTWDALDAVWPEGSAGVALAALRAGRVARAEAILDALEPLRGADGSLPTFSVDVPFVFDTKPSLAGTAWVSIVRGEIERARSGAAPTFLVP